MVKSMEHSRMRALVGQLHDLLHSFGLTPPPLTGRLGSGRSESATEARDDGRPKSEPAAPPRPGGSEQPQAKPTGARAALEPSQRPVSDEPRRGRHQRKLDGPSGKSGPMGQRRYHKHMAVYCSRPCLFGLEPTTPAAMFDAGRPAPARAFQPGREGWRPLAHVVLALRRHGCQLSTARCTWIML